MAHEEGTGDGDGSDVSSLSCYHSLPEEEVETGERGDERRRWKIPSDEECGRDVPFRARTLPIVRVLAPRRRERSYAGAGDFERHPPPRLALLGCAGGRISFVPLTIDFLRRVE